MNVLEHILSQDDEHARYHTVRFETFESNQKNIQVDTFSHASGRCHPSMKRTHS